MTTLNVEPNLYLLRKGTLPSETFHWIPFLSELLRKSVEEREKKGNIWGIKNQTTKRKDDIRKQKNRPKRITKYWTDWKGRIKRKI